MLLSGTTLVLNYPLPFLHHFLSLTGPIKLGSSNKGEQQQRKQYWIPVFCRSPLCDRRRRGWRNNRELLPRQQKWFLLSPWVDGGSVGKDGEIEGWQMKEGDGGRCDRRHAYCQLRREWRVFKRQLVSLRGKTRSPEIRPSPLNIYALGPHRFLATFFCGFPRGCGVGAGGWGEVALALANPCAPRTHFWRYWHVNLQGNESLLKW